MIKKIKKFEIGQQYVFDGILCEIEKFPTRTSIVLKAVKPESGKWSSCKTSIREFEKTAALCEGLGLLVS